jgi:hypothetical protein
MTTMSNAQPMLDKIEHARIIADFDNVCLTAGVQGKFLHESMTQYCDPAEVDWVKNFYKFKKEGLPGLLLHGITRPDTRSQAIAAALIRNFIDARVIPLNSVLDAKENGDMPSPTVLLIPNLFVAATSKNIPAWKVQTVYDLLLQRSVQNKQSIVYVESMEGLKIAYGAPFADFLLSFKEVIK